MVDMTVGEHHRGRAQPMLGQHLREPVDHPDPGIDDQALLARGRRDHVAIGGEGRRRESHNEHGGDTTWLVGPRPKRYTT